MLSPLLCYFFHLCKIFFFTFCVFLYTIKYNLNIDRAIKSFLSKKSETSSLKTIINKLDFLNKAVISYYLMEHLKKKKDLLLLANKLIEKVPDPRNAKEHY